LPLYIDLAGKMIYDKPWVKEARKFLKLIPDETPRAKELASSYLDNYARFDRYPQIRGDWERFTNAAMRMTGRSILAFDTRLWMLHGARAFANILPEVPTKYFLHGLKETATDPIKTYQEAGQRGLLPTNITPWFFKHPMEKFDALGNAMSIADSIPDGIAYHGLKKMYMDQGFGPREASRMAVNRTKDISQRITPARAARLFTMPLGPLKPFTQFKQQIFKIIEQYTTAGPQIVRGLASGDRATQAQQAARLIRYVAGVGSMILMNKELKLSTWHLNPLHALTFHAPVYDRIGHILHKAASGDLTGALVDAGILALPGGYSIEQQLKKGPSMFTGAPSDQRVTPVPLKRKVVPVH